MLERQKIRNMVVDLLSDASTDASDRIYKSRITTIPAENCPAISVYTLNDVGEGRGDHLPEFETNTTLKLDALVAMNEHWDDELDQLCEQIEDALLKNPTFTKEFSRIGSYSTTISQQDGGEYPIAAAMITIGLIYDQTFEPTIHDELREVHVENPPHEMRIIFSGEE